jgi:hypothetical protein
MKKIIIIGLLTLLAFGGIGFGLYQTSNLGKVSGKLQETKTQLQKSQASLDEAMNLVKSEAFKNQFPLIPESVIIEKGLNKEAISEMIARATLPIVYSISTPQGLRSGDYGYARSGRVVIVGKENNRYVGFTTLCTVSLERPWKTTIKPEDKCNEVIIVGDKRTGLEWYKVKKDDNYINPDEPIAAAYAIESLITESERYTLTIHANQGWQLSNIRLNKGDEISVTASGQWRTSKDSDYYGADGYGQEGKRDNTPSASRKDFPVGALICTSDQKSGEFFYVGSESTFMSDIAGESLSFKINVSGGVLKGNDNDLGKLELTICVKKRSAPEKLKDIVSKRKEVIIEPIGENDMALIYFPADDETIFGKQEIFTLGLDSPSDKIRTAVEKGNKILGYKFVQYCEQCHQTIQRFDQIIGDERKKAYQEGYEVGKIEGKKELVSGVIRSGINCLMNLISCGISELVPDQEVSNLITPIVQSIAMDYLESKWPKWSEKIEKGIPIAELKGTLPKSLSELLPNTKLSPDDMMDSISKGIYKLAGIEGFDNPQAEKLMSSLLKGSEKISWLPIGNDENGKKEGSLLIDGQFVNQLLVSLGMAKVSKSDKKLPFLKEMKQSEQKAKENKMGIWK